MDENFFDQNNNNSESLGSDKKSPEEIRHLVTTNMLGMMNSKPPKLWADFDLEDLPEQRWKIKKLLPYEGLVIIASPAGEKKTWLAMEMAKAIANGVNFLGSDKFPTEGGAVLYIDQEMSKTERQRRGRLLGLAKTKNPIYLHDQDEVKLSEDDELRSLEYIIERYEIKAVFIDTLRAIAGGLKEDKAEEVREFFNRFKRFKDMGVVVVFLDHCRKPQRLEGNVPRKEQLLGSQDKVASIESLLMIKTDEETKEILIYQRKNRNAEEVQPFKVEMIDEVDNNLQVISISMKYAGLVEEKEYKVDKAKGIVLNILSEGPKKTKEICSLLSESKIGEKNTQVALRSLEKDKVISSTGGGKAGKTYYISESQKEFDNF